jgi:hypothetical protein
VTSSPKRELSDSPAPARAGLGNTWPLFGEASPAFPADPLQNVTPFRPAPAELAALEQNVGLPETTEQAEGDVRRIHESLPPAALTAEWARAARALVDWLSERLARGEVDAVDEAAVARTWSAFALGGVTPPQMLRVAHVVSRAHSAILHAPADEKLQAAFHSCAGVLHAGLPRAVRERMPLERTVEVVRALHAEKDPWSAVVEGTSELLGWKDYARAHAASLLRAVIEKGH